MLGTFSFVPGGLFGLTPEEKQFHFIGLGSGGTNVIQHIQKKGIEGDFSCMSWFPSFVEPYKGINHIFYEYPREIRNATMLGRQRQPLTAEIKATLLKDQFYVVFCGLGGFTGTSLISDVLEFLETNCIKHIAVCTLPDKGEGRFRNDYALSKQIELGKYKNVFYYNHHTTIRKYGDLPVSKAFACADEELFRIFQTHAVKLTTAS